MGLVIRLAVIKLLHIGSVIQVGSEIPVMTRTTDMSAFAERTLMLFSFHCPTSEVLLKISSDEQYQHMRLQKSDSVKRQTACMLTKLACSRVSILGRTRNKVQCA